MAKKKKQNKPRMLVSGKSTSSSTEARTNPFDIHFNKIKRNVIGRKLMRCEQGRPNRSRHEAVEKRKKTLLVEYLKKDKAGNFNDKRISDESGGLAVRKAKIFDLKMKGTVEMPLTHRGEQLTSENLLTDRPEFDDFEEDIDLNLLKREDYVESAHFGGGPESSEKKKSQSEFLDDVMNEKRKRQYEQEMNWSLTEKLDDEWKDVRTLLNINSGSKAPTIDSNSSREVAKDDNSSVVTKEYDIVMRELLFASKSAKTKIKSSQEGTKVVGDESTGPSERQRKVHVHRTQEQLIDQEERREAIQRIREKDIVILPLFDPVIESLNRKRDPIKKLQKKVKREYRGAQRELRKDTAFLKDVWMKEIADRDETRKKRVNKIIADIASDIHDVRRIKKEN